MDADVVDGEDVGVVQRGDGLPLALEAGEAVGVDCDVGAKNLQGNAAVEPGSRAS